MISQFFIEGQNRASADGKYRRYFFAKAMF